MAYRNKKQNKGRIDHKPVIMRPLEVAAYFNISVNTVWRWVKSGALPEPSRMGKRFTYWQRKDIENALATMQQHSC